MPYTPLHQAHFFIQNLRNFRGNSIHGDWIPAGWSIGTGMLNDNERCLLKATYETGNIYVVYSYDTPIAWYSIPGGWHVVTQKFSRTTSRHQSIVRRALAPALAA